MQTLLKPIWVQESRKDFFLCQCFKTILSLIDGFPCNLQIVRKVTGCILLVGRTLRILDSTRSQPQTILASEV